MLPKKYQHLFQEGGKAKHIRFKDGVWEIRVRIDGVDYSALASSRKEALRRFVRKLRGEDDGKRGFPSAPRTFHEFSMFYFETYRKRKVRPLTLENDLYRYRKHLRPYFGSIPLKNITPDQCQRLLDGLVEKGQTKLQLELYTLMNVIFKMALAYGIISKNPLAIVIKERHHQQHGKALTKEEEKKLLEGTAGTRYQLLFALALYTGMRPNEYVTARIEGDFIVANNSKRKAGKVESKKIPIIPMLQPYLVGVTEFVFPRMEYIRDRMKSILPNHRLYDLRTTFYTRCDECGVAPPARDEFVGHSRGVLTDTYSDLSDEYLLKEGMKLKW